MNGEKEFNYTVPDYFNGKLRVMAVAVSPDKIGTTRTATTVRGDFVLSPNAPTTLAPGDEADVSVGVVQQSHRPRARRCRSRCHAQDRPAIADRSASATQTALAGADA